MTTTTTVPPVGSLTLRKAKARAQRGPGAANGSLGVQGEFVTPPVFTHPPPFIVRVQDGLTLDRTHAFQACRTSNRGRITCRDVDVDGIFKASVKPSRRVPGTMAFKIKFQWQTIDAPFAPPMTMTLVHNAAVVRQGSASICTSKGRSFKCK